MCWSMSGRVLVETDELPNCFMLLSINIFPRLRVAVLAVGFQWIMQGLKSPNLVIMGLDPS